MYALKIAYAICIKVPLTLFNFKNLSFFLFIDKWLIISTLSNMYTRCSAYFSLPEFRTSFRALGCCDCFGKIKVYL